MVTKSERKRDTWTWVLESSIGIVKAKINHFEQEGSILTHLSQCE